MRFHEIFLLSLWKFKSTVMEPWIHFSSWKKWWIESFFWVISLDINVKFEIFINFSHSLSYNSFESSFFLNHTRRYASFASLRLTWNHLPFFFFLPETLWTFLTCTKNNTMKNLQKAFFISTFAQFISSNLIYVNLDIAVETRRKKKM